MQTASDRQTGELLQQLKIRSLLRCSKTPARLLLLFCLCIRVFSLLPSYVNRYLMAAKTVLVGYNIRLTWCTQTYRVLIRHYYPSLLPTTASPKETIERG